MTHVSWHGCSFTVGEGFPKNQRSDFIYRSLVDKHFSFTSDMLAISGGSNYNIFMSAAQSIISNRYDIVFVQWSALNRLWLHPGPDSNFSINDEKDVDFQYRNIYLSAKDKEQLKQRLLILNHDYHNILDVIQYCNILENLSLGKKSKVVFINGLLPWTDDLNKSINRTDLSSTLSSYTKSILDFDSRDDTEIIKFFEELQSKFSTLNQSLWVNIFDSMRKMTVDVGPEGHHPGAKTHQWMYNQVSTYLENIK